MRRPSDRRDITISFRVKEQEAALIKQQIIKEGWGGGRHTTWIRHVVLERIKKYKHG